MPGLILTGHESGKVALFDAHTGDEVLSNERAHMDVVTDLQLSADRSYFITSSKDKTARIHDTKTLTVLKTFPTETPLNSAALAPNLPYVLLGGGQEAMSVTMTSLRQGKFEARFWHRIFEEEVGRVKGHFGPLNTYVDDRFTVRSRVDIAEPGSLFIRQGRPMHLGEKTDSYACTTLMRATSRHARMVKQKFSTRGSFCCMMFAVSLRI